METRQLDPAQARSQTCPVGQLGAHARAQAPWQQVGPGMADQPKLQGRVSGNPGISSIQNHNLRIMCNKKPSCACTCGLLSWSSAGTSSQANTPHPLVKSVGCSYPSWFCPHHAGPRTADSPKQYKFPCSYHSVPQALGRPMPEPPEVVGTQLLTLSRQLEDLKLDKKILAPSGPQVSAAPEVLDTTHDQSRLLAGLLDHSLSTPLVPCNPHAWASLPTPAPQLNSRSSTTYRIACGHR